MPPATETGETPGRFVLARERMLLFAATCDEAQVVAERLGPEIARLRPRPPALRIYQAGAGEGTLLNMLLRHLHERFPTVPFVVAVREASADCLRLAARNLADRFAEHPELALVLTDAAPGLPGPETRWWRHELEGGASHGFEIQIDALVDELQARWAHARPSALLLHRADQAFALHQALPGPAGAGAGDADHGAGTGAGTAGTSAAASGFGAGFDLVVAAQAYPSRLDTARKVAGMLEPLARCLAPGGRMAVVQSTGRDPGMDIVHGIWPGEAPFPTPRGVLMEHLDAALAGSELTLVEPPPSQAELRYTLQLNPQDETAGIGTSSLFAAWNAATFVAQIDAGRLGRAMSDSGYLDATARVLAAHQGLWFRNELFLVIRAG